MQKPRDYQRQKVYNWEADFELPSSPKSFEVVRVLTLLVWEDYMSGTTPPKILPGRRDGRPNGSARHITLPAESRTSEAILHEVAHAIIDATPGLEKEPWHGPVFMELYIQLLLRYQPHKYEESTLRDLAANRGLIVAYNYKEVPKPKGDSHG